MVAEVTFAQAQDAVDWDYYAASDSLLLPA